MTHGFDDRGRLVDGNGNIELRIWSTGTVAAHERRSACFTKQYSRLALEQLGNLTGLLDGRQTMNENIADNGGIRVAFGAFKRLLDASAERGVVVPGLDGYTAEQQFFIGYAYSWCSLESDRSMAERLESDSHAPMSTRFVLLK